MNLGKVIRYLAKNVFFLFPIILQNFVTYSSILGSKNPETTLKFVHVLSGNKYYVPDFNPDSKVFQFPGELSYDYFLKNSQDIPNKRKLELYNVGMQLRKTYGEFLNYTYSPASMNMETTEYATSILAGELINAGLWPPTGDQIWNQDLIWQPVIYDYKPAEKDIVLLGNLCPSFEQDLEYVIKIHKTTMANSSYLETISCLKNETRISDIRNPIEVSLLYKALKNSADLDQTLPRWTADVSSIYSMENLTRTSYELMSNTLTQKKLNGGTFLKKIINHTKKLSPSEVRKMTIYSGDDLLLMGILSILNQNFDASNSALIFEVHADAVNNKFIKIISLYTQEDIIKQKNIYIRGCGQDGLCSISTFENTIKIVLPKDEEEKNLCEKSSKPSGGNIAMPKFIIIVCVALIGIFFS